MLLDENERQKRILTDRWVEEDRSFRGQVISCKGAWTVSRVYPDGGESVNHGLWENCPCTCGLESHYSSPNGGVYSCLGDYHDRRLGW